ncbi:MAG: ComEC/Rec2 family competence protein, partial [Bacteroidales bacterium]|nr:ComEC/Rec2 family competence protein [Bacteroidales bacterium]
FKKFAARDSLGDFNERGYWYGYGIRLHDWIDSSAILQISHHSERKFSEVLRKARNSVFERIGKLNLAVENQAILLAMLTGNKSGLTSESKKQFSRLGIMHLLAVSGLHAGLIYLIFSKIFQFLRIPTHSAWNRFLSSIIVWLYVMICGFPASAIRAAAMISMHGFAHVLHRAVSGVQIVFLVAFMHTLVQPEAVFSIGFQLSYLAVLGIIVFYPKIQKIIQVSPKILSKIRDLAAISLSAQILTLPVSIYVFASFPVWFLLANILLMPIGLLIFYFGLVLLVLISIGLPVDIPEQILDHIMSIWMGLGGGIADLPGSLLTLSDYPWMFFAVYIILIFFSRFGLNKLLLRPYPLLMLFMIWSLHGFLNTFWNNL